ncbi:hypothetical protein GGQ97_002731 [Sphingomonas kaistensis]|uniref:Rhamnogalacturonase A/B/Epimerase-like pectate lyase domain-containing protein n=1 Tax=Sphingomonas kaistensis TaxID=298708 RepID=A0A7X6BHG7_9SPHN|nr:hypothetical protein [Sphingomonas kaistensis]
MTTSTQGTGPFLCGPAVTGFASFAESVSAGDSFYYSVQGVDKPQEREVGRGTYLANGTITRSALGGCLTHFSSGAKTIALVAAAEWYAGVQESLAQGGDSSIVANRTALTAPAAGAIGACLLKELGREGMFSWDPAVPPAVHQADPGQGLFVAPSATANGAWVRRFDGPVNVRWFGAKGDGSTNDGAAFTRALTCLRAVAQQGFGYGIGTNRLYVPKGHYFLGTTTLDLSASMVIEGDSSGLPSGGASVLRWSANTTGIRIQGSGTSGAEATKPTDYVTGTSMVRGLHLIGGYIHGSTAEGEFHGVHMRAMAAVEDCFIRGFQGDGIHARGDVGFGNNANQSCVTRTSIELCRNGVFLQGGDANACTFSHLNVNSNRQWGVLDRSFLGNTFIGCHSATNGSMIDSSGPSIVAANRARYGGRVYAVLIGQEDWCSTNAPSGTDATNQGWHYIGPMADDQPWNNIRGWVSGSAYRSGGSYAASDANNRTQYLSCYSEGDMAPSQIYGRGRVDGGLHENGVRGLYVYNEYDGLRVGGNYLTACKGFRAWGPTELGEGDKPFQGASILSSNYSFLKFKVNYADIAEIYANASGLHLSASTQGVRLQVAAVTTATVTADGIDLTAGKTLRVAGTQVVGAQRTGWTAATGAANRSAFAAATAGTAAATYVQTEAQEVRNRIAALEARLVALETDCRAHGLIN